MLLIEVPKMNDSFSRIVLGGVETQLRFTYNDTFDYWTLGIYNQYKEPLLIGLKIVPGFPLNLFTKDRPDIPQGFFIAKSQKEKIGHDDFFNGNASFYFVLDYEE